MTLQSNNDTLITVFGGSGFLGRHLVRALAKRHYRIRVAVRRPDLAGHLQPLGRVGQIHAVQANLRYSRSVEAAVRDADVVINLAGILFERSRQRFDTVQTFGAEQVALAAAAHGARMIHVSAIGADESSPSLYAQSKALGEKAALAAVPDATIVRPSIMFGPEDDFFNRFASLARMSPALPLIGGGQTRFQPVFVGDGREPVEELILRPEHDRRTQDGCARHRSTHQLLAHRLAARIVRRRLLIGTDRGDMHQPRAMRRRRQRAGLGTERLHGVEPLAAALEQDADEIDHRIGIAHRGVNRARMAQVGLHRMDLADPAGRLQVDGEVRPSYRDPDAVAALGQRTHHMAAQEARAAEDGDERFGRSGGHAAVFRAMG